MAKEKILALITASEATKNDLCNQLNSLLEGYMRVDGYATETGINGVVKADLIVLSSRMMIEEAKDYVDTKANVIIANRSLNLESIDKLFHIPKGTEILLVNDEMENAEEVIKLLREIGLDYLNYIPYAPGNRVNSIAKLAVTPGEVALVPKHIETVIDIGARVIDITTIIEILSLLGLLDEKSHFVSTKYMETIIRLNKQLHDSIEEAGSTNRYLVKVLNQVNDGIIAFSDNGIISVFNQKSEELFAIKSQFAIGKNINQIIRDKSISDYLAEGSETSDQLFKTGDTDVIISKFKIEKLQSTVCTIKNTKDTIDMEKRLRQNLVKKGFVGKYKFEDIVGNSQIMKSTIDTAIKLAAADLSILISGESGVGKELFASAIHNMSIRNTGPFLAVNFSALPEELAESELFGYEEGSFTGARKGGRIGLFEQANGGTIFLDEIGDISLRIQARLLRVLQEKEIRRVGGTEIIPINVRVIAATNKNLALMCQAGLFREDLYHRLRKLYLKVPPLREHNEDIEELIEHFIRLNGRSSLKISEEAMKILEANPWSGNVRELSNTIDYFNAVSNSGYIGIEDIPHDFFEMQYEHKIIGGWNGDKYSDELSSQGQIKEFIFILNTINENSLGGKATSRKAILAHAGIEIPHLSEDKIRRRADILEKVGLIVKGSGRLGMRLTQEGEKYIKYFQSKN
jgi:sigma-54 dependent transcriptional regulator, acetoin dehydrogenase operon transcriptional activator AcoR